MDLIARVLSTALVHRGTRERYRQARNDNDTKAHIATFALRGTYVWNVAITHTTDAASVRRGPNITVNAPVQATTKSRNSGNVVGTNSACRITEIKDGRLRSRTEIVKASFLARLCAQSVSSQGPPVVAWAT
jgi:hypothetical protein